MAIHLWSDIAIRLVRSIPVPPPYQLVADRDSKGHFSRRNLFDLAQGGVFQAWDITIPSGKLLPYLFTLIPTHVVTVSLSVALSLGLPPVAADDRLALLSSDFPPG